MPRRGGGSSPGRTGKPPSDRLRAWVEQIYLPGYGHLAAALPPCWEHHLLCLYTLDWLSELWSALYLDTRPRHAARLAAQAEWQTRLLPAAADQMASTHRCQHGCRTPAARSVTPHQLTSDLPETDRRPS